MLSVVVFALISIVVSTQEIFCPELLDSLLECAGSQSQSAEIVAIPLACVEEAGAFVEDLGVCGLLDVPPTLETEIVESEEELVTFTIGEATIKPIVLTILPKGLVVPIPAPFIIINVPALVTVPVPAAFAPIPTPTPSPTTFASPDVDASASVSGGAVSVDAAAVASIIS